VPEQDPWDVLGVPKGADAATLKRAKRARQRALHPDRVGGDGAAMAAVNQAYDILTDPARLLRYEREGHDVPHVPPAEQAARQVILVAVQQILSRPELPRGGILREVHTALVRERGVVAQAAPAIQGMLAAARRAQKRLKFKGESPEKDFLAGLFDERIQGLERLLEQQGVDLVKLNRALELLRDYEETTDPADGADAIQWKFLEVPR
jgi:curved DNA-binding protein CbpA